MDLHPHIFVWINVPYSRDFFSALEVRSGGQPAVQSRQKRGKKKLWSGPLFLRATDPICQTDSSSASAASISYKASFCIFDSLFGYPMPKYLLGCFLFFVSCFALAASPTRSSLSGTLLIDKTFRTCLHWMYGHEKIMELILQDERQSSGCDLKQLPSTARVNAVCWLTWSPELPCSFHSFWVLLLEHTDCRPLFQFAMLSWWISNKMYILGCLTAESS